MEEINVYKNSSNEFACIVILTKKDFDNLNADIKESIGRNKDLDDILYDIFLDFKSYGIEFEFEEENDYNAEANSNYQKDAI